jgi:hypothetical protein
MEVVEKNGSTLGDFLTVRLGFKHKMFYEFKMPTGQCHLCYQVCLVIDIYEQTKDKF